MCRVAQRSGRAETDAGYRSFKERWYASDRGTCYPYGTGQIPVIVPNDIDNESEYIDPRETALEIAEKMQADKLVYLSKYPGIYKDEERKDIYYKITVPEVEKLRKERNFPKEFDEIIGYGLQASKNGVNRVHILDGRIRHVLLIEFFSVNGAGTIFIETEAKLYLHELGK